MDSDTVIIVAASGRALAASARRGGFVPLVVDYFGDSDTLALAHAHARLERGLARGITPHALDRALAKVIGTARPRGVVCGTGFEDRPNLVDHLAQRLPVLGNSADTIARVKNPEEFASICRACGIRHPEVSLTRPRDPVGWLAKRQGGAGGGHIRPAAARVLAKHSYFQREVAGTPVSVLFLANGSAARIVGLSTQWASPAPHRPYRYGGALRPAELGARVSDALVASIHRLITRIPFSGLNSADFLVEGEDFRLLEINPRPSASLDLFEPPGGSLFALHMSACAGELASVVPSLPNATATMVVYAERDATIPDIAWPEWTADRPHAGAAIAAGEPLCTVLASAATAAEARRLVDDRLAMVLAWTHASN